MIMGKLYGTLFGLMMICFVGIAQGQNVKTVEVYTGRGDMRNPQKIMDLSYQNLDKVPVVALNSEIETLILDNNNITKLPQWLGQLKNLKVLSIRNNKLSELDYVVTNCDKLEQIYLSGNRNLSDISVISSLRNIELIDVVGTKINQLPPGIQMMDNLFYFKYTKID